MLILTSPAKTIESQAGKNTYGTTFHRFNKETQELIRLLRKKNRNELKKLMKISDKLAEENYNRFQDFSKEFTLTNSSPALLAFKGDVYLGLDAETLNEDDLAFAQGHLCILSGLYGVLRPLDLMQPYRLEIGTAMKNPCGNNLYEFWGDKITAALNEDLQEWNMDEVLNLASNEYFKSVQKNKLNAKIFKAQFKEDRNGTLTFISYHAKKARGLLMRYIIDNRLEKVEQIKSFNLDGYMFSQSHSTADEFIFIR